MSEVHTIPQPASNANTWRAAHFVLAAVIVALDQFTKYAVATKVALNVGWVDVIPGFFAITHVQNTGAAFSLFAEPSSAWKLTMLILFSVVAMMIVTYFLWRAGSTFSSTGVALALILGGAFGNLWDRVKHGHVTDFLHVYIGEYSWPDFNVADSAIVIGALLLIAEILLTSSDHKHA